MKARLKWVWIVTVANAIASGLLTLAVYATLIFLAVLAPVIRTGPVFAVLLPVGVALSVVGLKLTAGLASSVGRWAAYLANGLALAIDVAIVLGLAAIFIRSIAVKIIIPDGYKGDVYIFYRVADGVSSRTPSGVTDRIAQDGILGVREPPDYGFTRTEYYYQRKDGTLEPIRNFWPTTIHPSPENLTNDRDFGVYFPRGVGKFVDSSGCTHEYELFYVGTKAHLLANSATDSFRDAFSRYTHDYRTRCPN